MKPSTERVLKELKRKKRKGITGEDFPKMTSYTKRLGRRSVRGPHRHSPRS